MQIEQTLTVIKARVTPGVVPQFAPRATRGFILRLRFIPLHSAGASGVWGKSVQVARVACGKPQVCQEPQTQKRIEVGVFCIRFRTPRVCVFKKPYRRGREGHEILAHLEENTHTQRQGQGTPPAQPNPDTHLDVELETKLEPTMGTPQTGAVASPPRRKLTTMVSPSSSLRSACASSSLAAASSLVSASAERGRLPARS